MKRKAQARVLAFVALLCAMATQAAFASPAAHAAPAGETYNSMVNGIGCLRHDYAGGSVYTGSCDGVGARWSPIKMSNGSIQLVSGGGGACLDSNFAGQVYAISCNGGNYQRWWPLYVGFTGRFGFRNSATNNCVTVDLSHTLYTSVCTFWPNSPELIPQQAWT